MQLGRSVRFAFLASLAFVVPVVLGACGPDRPANKPPAPVASASSSSAVAVATDDPDGPVGPDPRAPSDPIVPHAKVTATQISVGSVSCITSTAGEVWCWGDGDSGGFGDQSRRRSQSTPLQIPGLTNVSYVDSRSASPCALKKDGTVWCWGMAIGQTAPGAHDAHSWGYAVAQVPGLSDIVQISSAGSRLLARRSDGAVLLWGKPFQTLGSVTKPGQKKPSVRLITTPRITQPTEVPALRGAVDIAEGGGQMPSGCARMKDGKVLCWSTAKSLGEGWGNEHLVETPTAVPEVNGAKEIAVSESHACARMDGGKVLCWGRNGDGQLGDGTTADRWKPAPVKDLTGATSLSIGIGFMCAMLADKTARCWGKPLDVSLFADGSAPRVQPTPKKLGVTGIKEIALHVWSACARVERAGDPDPNGSLVCWGKNQFADVGDGSQTDRATPVLVALPGASGAAPSVTPAPTAALVPTSAPVSISAGGDTTCAAFADGSVRCWGSSEFGQIGDGTTEGHACPVLADVTNVTQVSVGVVHACARTSDGHMKCWGANYGGELGNGAHDSGSSVPVDTRIDHVAKISAGSWTCALKDDKRVFCFGDWDSGEKTGSFLPRDVGVSGATDIAAGSSAGCALIGDHVKCFGRRWSGTVSPAAAALRDVTAIGAAEGACAVRKNGMVTCWGTPNVPQIASRQDQHAVADAPLWADVAQLSVGTDLACAIRTDGTVLCQAEKKLPAVVPGLAQVVEITAGRAHACARTSAGKILCWGENDKGQLGNGTTTATQAPVEVTWCGK